MAAIEPGAIRIEPLAQDATLAEGLRMAIADPAWMLARQRQFGELTAHDAGSPAAAALTREAGPLTRYLPRLPNTAAGQVTDLSTIPLEAVAEHEPPATDGGALLAALAGLHYQRLLSDETTSAAGVADEATPAAAVADEATLAAGVAKYLTALTIKYPFTVPGSSHPLLTLLEGSTALDGTALYQDLHAALTASPPSLPSVPAVDLAARPTVTAAATTYLGYYQALTGGVPGGTTAWATTRMEYQFALGGRVPDGSEVVLCASEFDSGHLDWYALDITGSSVGASQDPLPPAASAMTFLPAPVTFPGMPAARLWTLEDSSVNLDRLQAAAQDIGAMLVLEFALSYSAEFYLVPLPLDAGTLWRVSGLQVTDTFGITTAIPPAATPRLFAHNLDGSTSTSPWSVLFPAAAETRQSPPREDIQFLRDELDDICWAVEKIATPATGVPLDRDTDTARQRTSAPPTDPASGLLYYQLHSAVPGNWYPLVSQDPAGRTVTLLQIDGQQPPIGQVLTELASTPIPQEEITRTGKRLTRNWRYTRGTDGTQILWAARRALTPPPTTPVRLSFDITTPPETTAKENQ